MHHIWKALKFLLRHFFQIVGVLTVLLVIVIVGIARNMSSQAPVLPADMLVTLDLSGGVYEGEPDVLEMYLGGRGWPLVSLLAHLEDMAEDPRVHGVLLNLSSLSLNPAQAEELRAALVNLQQHDKTVVAFADTFGEMTPANTLYFLASACSEVWMQPSGMVGLTGYATEVPFFKGTLEKVGVTPQFAKRQAYKTFPNMFEEDHLTAEHRESLEYLLNGLSSQLIASIAEGREIYPEDVKKIFARAPLDAQAAQSAKLIDRLAYWVTAPQMLQALMGQDTGEIVKAEDYYRDTTLPEDAPVVAVIQASGEILGGPTDGLGVDDMIVGPELAQVIADAAADENVDAILIRLDSPGGSYVAADTVWQAIMTHRQTLNMPVPGTADIVSEDIPRKPIVVWVGEVAASGGYFIAMAGDYVLAAPNSLLGSIGVFSGKFVAQDLMQTLGVSWDRVATDSTSSLMYSNTKPFTPAEWDKLQAQMDIIYNDFKQKVGDSRGLSPEDVQNLAQGKVWTGATALKLGLIDELGGFSESKQAVRKLLQVAADTPLDLQAWPAAKSPVEEVLEILSAAPPQLQALGQTLATLEPAIQWLHSSGLLHGVNTLEQPMPVVQ